MFDLHKVFSSEETQAEVRAGCTSAGIGCIQCKGWLADAVVKELTPIQERRAHFEANPDEVDAILDDGAFRANGRTGKRCGRCFDAVGLRPAMSEEIMNESSENTDSERYAFHFFFFFFFFFFFI